MAGRRIVNANPAARSIHQFGPSAVRPNDLLNELTMPLPVPSSPIEPLPARTASSTPGQPQRFTLDGSAELEAQLAAIGEEVLTAIRRIVPERKLEAVMLGGGYGRGEGGGLKTEAGAGPYNDLEFYICARRHRPRNERRYRGLVGNQAEEIAPAVRLG